MQTTSRGPLVFQVAVCVQLIVSVCGGQRVSVCSGGLVERGEKRNISY